MNDIFNYLGLIEEEQSLILHLLPEGLSPVELASDYGCSREDFFDSFQLGLFKVHMNKLRPSIPRSTFRHFRAMV